MQPPTNSIFGATWKNDHFSRLGNNNLSTPLLGLLFVCVLEFGLVGALVNVLTYANKSKFAKHDSTTKLKSPRHFCICEFRGCVCLCDTAYCDFLKRKQFMFNGMTWHGVRTSEVRISYNAYKWLIQYTGYYMWQSSVDKRKSLSLWLYSQML